MRDYVRTVRGVDDAIGRLLDKLDKMRISENTLVIHTSDHGYFHGEFGLADKRWMYDPSIRVPYLIRYPKLIRSPGRIVEDLVLSLDIPATIMDLSGLGVPQNFQGHSLKSLMIGTDEWTRDAVFIEYFEDPPFPALPTMICLRTTDEKIVHYLREGEGDEFYDLVRDPGEQRNVIDDSEYAGRVSQMKNRLEETRNRYDFTVLDLSKQY